MLILHATIFYILLEESVMEKSKIIAVLDSILVSSKAWIKPAIRVDYE